MRGGKKVSTKCGKKGKKRRRMSEREGEDPQEIKSYCKDIKRGKKNRL